MTLSRIEPHARIEGGFLEVYQCARCQLLEKIIHVEGAAPVLLHDEVRVERRRLLS
jgi:hypothetical protein